MNIRLIFSSLVASAALCAMLGTARAQIFEANLTSARQALCPIPRIRGSGRFGGLMRHISAILASLSLTVCLAGNGWAQSTYTITDLGPPPGGFSSFGQGINASGQVGGLYYYTSGGHFFYHAAMFSAGTVTDLGTFGGASCTYCVSSGYGINDSAQVTGYSYNTSATMQVQSGPLHAFLYSAGIMTDLGTLVGPAGNSLGLGINDSGQITGWSSTSASDSSLRHAFLYSSGTMTDLGTLGGISEGAGINASGQVAGHSSTSASDPSAIHAVLFSAGTVTDLGTLGGPGCVTCRSSAVGINASAEVTGWSHPCPPTFCNEIHAFLYIAGIMLDLGTLPGASQSIGNSINTSDQVVGCSGVGTASGNCQDTFHAFLYTPGQGMIDLNTVLPSGSGWTLLDATAINDAGQITGGGVINGAHHAFLLTPASVTPSGNPLGDALVGGGSPSLLYACPECTKNPVNSATGEFFHTFKQLSVPGRGVPLAFAQTYSSARAAQDSPLGFGWTDSYNLSLSFDNSGNATVHEEGGSQVTFAVASSTYTPPGYVLATLVKNNDGTYTFTRDQTQISYVFDSSGRLIREVDRNGYQTNLTYNGNGQLASVTDPAGRSITFSYGGNGKLASLTDPGSRSLQFAYDGSGNLTQLTDLAGGKWTFSYDASHRMLSMTDPRNGVTSNVYDSSGKVTSQTDAMGRVTSFSYSSGSGGSETTVVTDPAGHQTQLVYQNLLLSEQTRGFGSGQAATTHYSYDTNTLGVTSETDPNGHTTSSTYDARGNLLSRTDPLGRSWHFTYNNFNEPLTKTDPLGVTTTYTYDTHGNLTSASTPIGPHVSRTTYSYGDTSHLGDVTALTDPDGHTWNFAYDGQGDRIRVTDPLGNVTTFAYNVLGELTSTVTPKGNVQNGNPAAYRTSFSYNAFGDMASKTDPLGHTTTYTYDANRNLSAMRDPNGHTTNYTYDLDNERTSTTLDDGSTTSTHYNADGTVNDQVDGLGHTTSFAYDTLGRVTGMTDPLNRTTSYTYDAAGNLTALTDPAGRTTSYSHDAANQLTAIAYSDATTHNVSFSYDDDGHRLSMIDGTGTTSYAYDALGRLTDSTNGTGAHVAYGYDLANNIIRITYPSGNAVTRTYGQDNRLAAIRDWLGHTTSFSYDPNANLTGETYPNGVTAAFSYDRSDQLLSIKDAKGGKNLMSLAYHRDADGLVSTENATAFGYDAANRVTTGGATSYQYNAADELTHIGQATLAYDTATQLTSLTRGSSTTAFYYDPQGNRSAAVPSSGPHVNYSYDQANRLVSFTRQATNGQGVTAATYTFNGDGLRMGKTVAGTSSAFVWDTAEGVPLLLKDGTTTYVTGPGGLPLEQISSAGAVLYYHTDQIGSIRMLTDSSGKIAATYSYDAYGNASANASTTVNPFGFAGQYADAESGLIYMRARSYDPASGQFLSVDPLATLTREPYPYVHDDPVNLTDPSGQFDERKPVGKVAYTDSDRPGETALVLVQRHGSKAWFFAYRGMPIYLGDKVRDAEGSVSGIEFDNGMQIGINVETTVLIDTEGTVKDISIRSRWTKFKLQAGALWCKITHQSADESFTVETRGGVLGTRDAGPWLYQ